MPSATEPARRRETRARRVVTIAAVSGLMLAGCFDRPPGAAGGAEGVRRIGYGTVMVDIAHRFEVLGRAIVANRFELAAYEAGEIEEEFKDTLPHATPPGEGHPEVLPELVSSFVGTSLPDLQTALSVADRDMAIAAFGRTADACNSCHAASGHGFIEIPSQPGQAVPVLTPATP